MISVVIPVLGNFGFTEKCLNSLQAKSKLVDEIIIIDNDDEATTTKILLEGDYKYSFYIPGSNLGVSKSWDIGIKLTKNNIVAVINNDVEILEDNWDEILIHEWDKYPDGAIFCPWPCSSANEHLCKDCEPLKGLNGSFFVLKKDIIQQTENYKTKGEYIDTNFKRAYWEDVDLITQVRKLGLEGYVTQSIKTVHYSNQTAGPLLPKHKGMDNPYWSNLDYFNHKYNVHIWDYFEVFMSNVQDENSHKRLI